MPPDPVVAVEGPESERFARTRRIRTTFRCPACPYFCGAQAPHVPGSGLPPELRDVAAWRSEAEAKRAREQMVQLEASARRSYAAHRCAAAQE